MTIELVKAEDCIQQKKNVVKTNNDIDNIDNIDNNIFHKIELISEDECSSIKKRWEEKKRKNYSKHELGWAIRLGEDIPKDDKRYSCKFYDSDTRLCFLYNRRQCGNCIRYKSKFLDIYNNNYNNKNNNDS